MDFNRATFVLFAAMLEAMRAKAARAIVTVTDARMERILRRAGWPLQRLSEPQQLGQTTAIAGFLHDSDQALGSHVPAGWCRWTLSSSSRICAARPDWLASSRTAHKHAGRPTS